jgi:hypothetical protein
MTQERYVHSDLRSLLMGGSPGFEGDTNEPLEFAHLIKFERPSRPDKVSGKVSTSAVRYTYLTDASRDIDYDDGSKNLQGAANGTQKYLANKILKISGVSESTEAKASNFTITVDGNGLGAEIGPQLMDIVAVSATEYDISISDSNVDPVALGFREGDKITFTGSRSGDFNIVNFRANNTIRIRKIDVDLPINSGTIGFRLASEEVKSILMNKSENDYASFINREVFIYRVYQKDGLTIGAPILLFKGIISNVGFEDDDNGIVVTWGLTSHWGDFSQVRGRITSDDFHRALDENGIPQPASAIKPIYAYDKGFIHSETSINLLSTYVVQVEKQRIKAKKGFFGIGAKVKVKKYLEPEDRHTDLDFQLSAKSIPVMYGVRTTVGIPVFADTLKNDSSEVYVAYALCEGEIGGIYDMYINGKSLICNDKTDFDARSKQTPDNTIDVVCRGRADRGDVLGGNTSVAIPTASVDYYDTPTAKEVFSLVFNKNSLTKYQPYIAPSIENASYSSIGKGIINGESISMQDPQEMTIDFFSGKEGQKAASQLVSIAKNNGFKVQNDFWMGSDSSEYWGPNHRLLDTAYIVAKYKIKEGETTIPELEFILRCKIIDCYNYDYSYAHDPKVSENADNFLLGDTVNLVNTANSAVLNTGVQIVDKWSFIDANGQTETRFRFSVPPALSYVDGVPSITRFRMVKGASTWTMTTFNYVEHSGVVPSTIQTTISSTTDNAGLLSISYASTPIVAVGKDPSQSSPLYSAYKPDGTIAYGGALLSGTVSGTGLATGYNYRHISFGENLP